MQILMNSQKYTEKYTLCIFCRTQGIIKKKIYFSKISARQKINENGPKLSINDSTKQVITILIRLGHYKSLEVK